MTASAMKLICALAVSYTILLAQTDPIATRSVTAVRDWSFPDVTRVAVEVSGSFEFRSDRLTNPERVYFDILNSRPRIESKRFYSKILNDKFVKRIRVAETNPGVTRVVLELAEGVEVRTRKGAVPPPETVKADPLPLPASPPVPAPVMLSPKHDLAVIRPPKPSP